MYNQRKDILFGPHLTAFLILLPAQLQDKQRKCLRIALSVFFGVLTVALCVLWVRSYSRREIVIDIKTARTIGSNNGYAFYSQFHFPNIPTPKKRWVFGSTDASPLPAEFAWENIPEKTILKVPYWFLTIASFFISVTCGFPYATRFSICTMLIATTLVAVLLGLGVWLAS